MEKTSPPFLASILRCFLSYFGFGPFERSKPLGVLFAFIVLIVPKVFLVRTFKRLNTLGVLFALLVSIMPKVFWFGPLKGRSLLTFFLLLLCLLCRRFFGSDL